GPGSVGRGGGRGRRGTGVAAGGGQPGGAPPSGVRGREAGAFRAVEAAVDGDDVPSGRVQQGRRDRGAHAARAVHPDLAVGDLGEPSPRVCSGMWTDPRTYPAARSASRRTSRTTTCSCGSRPARSAKAARGKEAGV